MPVSVATVLLGLLVEFSTTSTRRSSIVLVSIASLFVPATIKARASHSRAQSGISPLLNN